MLAQDVEQEHLYHLKNAVYLRVALKEPSQRNLPAYAEFLAYHSRLQEKIRSNNRLTMQDVDALTNLANEV